jgi:mRNA interferase MazF
MTFMSMTQTPRRGEIWLVDFEPSLGAEIRKVRPAVVVSLDQLARLPLRVVVPLTEWKPQYNQYSWFVQIMRTTANGLGKDSGADAFQVKSVSETRFTRLLGAVEAHELDAIAAAVAFVVGKP